MQKDFGGGLILWWVLLEHLPFSTISDFLICGFLDNIYVFFCNMILLVLMR